MDDSPWLLISVNRGGTRRVSGVGFVSHARPLNAGEWSRRDHFHLSDGLFVARLTLLAPHQNAARVKNAARPTFLSITITFVAALVFYLIAYSWLTRKQTASGPWQVLFTNDAAGVPELVIQQTNRGISNLHVRFVDEQLSPTQRTGFVEFRKPQTPTPFGQLIYDDLMFLPGTVTLDCFGHEVELLPRTLVLNRKPIAWASTTTNELKPAMKLSPEQRKKIKGGYRK